jgi:hypothetical protein
MGRLSPPLPFRPLSRRSGRIPALPLSSAQVLPEWITSTRRSMLLQRTAINPLTSCLTPGVHFAYSPLPSTPCGTVRAFGTFVPTTPSADFCRPVRRNRSLLSPDSGTYGRSPEVSSTAFRTQPPNLQPVPLMDMDFAVACPLARHRMPQIRFLYIGSYVCSTLLSDLPPPERPCASLLLHLHQVVEGTSTPELSNMLGTHEKRPRRLLGEALRFSETFL